MEILKRQSLVKSNVPFSVWPLILHHEHGIEVD